MTENIIGKEVNGVKVFSPAYMDSYGQEIYACLEKW